MTTLVQLALILSATMVYNRQYNTAGMARFGIFPFVSGEFATLLKEEKLKARTLDFPTNRLSKEPLS